MDKQLRINERIRISQIRVIAEDGSQLGVMTPQDALRLAREQGFDLVEVAPLATPPVCRIMDFNKFKYDLDKKERQAKKKHHIAKLKELKFKPHIEEHDYQVKLRKVKQFLSQGDKVKVTMVFRGRELTHVELGRRILDRLKTDLGAVGKVERDPSLEGRFMTMIFMPDQVGLKRSAKPAGKPSPATASGQAPVVAARPEGPAPDKP
ncbi:MAG: translation initiation factor IF-3 [Candidatus Omnitrophica bacterium]|nr:translation initiation factor IF-3 [Candidatus Omnitrophota bacterium]